MNGRTSSHSFQLVGGESFSHIKLKLSRDTFPWEDMKLNTFNGNQTGTLRRRISLELYSFRVPECQVLAYILAEVKDPFAVGIKKRTSSYSILSFLCQGHREEKLWPHILESIVLVC